MSERDAIEAAARTIADHWTVSGGWQDGTTYDSLARAAYAAIAPIVRRDERERIVKAMRVYGDELGRTEIDPAAILAVEVLATAVKVMPEPKQADEEARRKARTA